MLQPIKILLYYKYVPLENPEAVRDAQKKLCEELGLKGRILVAKEGINGTIAGDTEQVDEYVAAMKNIPEFADMEFKVSWADEQVFPKLKVKVRDEIVTLGVKKTGDDVSLENKAEYISPEELHALYESGNEFVIVDARNEYEAIVGKFKDAIVPSIENFRDFPKFVEEQLNQYKDAEVVTYCTGGVRCEKASAYLKERGFKKVRQLHGGIHEYGVQTGGKHYEGELFVFDKRLHVPVNTVDPSVISHCAHCGVKITRYIDCTFFGCDSLFICCQGCEEKFSGHCPEVTSHREV